MAKQAKMAYRAYSSSLIRSIIACLFSKYIQSLYIFSYIFKYFALI